MGLAPPAFLDENGHPLSERIQAALRRLLPRFQLAFPLLRDETIVATLMELAGRRVMEAEHRHGRPIDKLHGYAWVTLRSVALSHMRGSEGQLAQATLGPAESSNVLATAAALSGTPAEIERRILLSEILATLTVEEQRLLLMKKAGFSSREIGDRLGKSVTAVDMMYSRVRTQIRAAMGLPEPSASARPRKIHNRDQE